MKIFLKMALIKGWFQARQLSVKKSQGLVIHFRNSTSHRKVEEKPPTRSFPSNEEQELHRSYHEFLQNCVPSDTFRVPKEWLNEVEELQTKSNEFVVKRSEKGKGDKYRCYIILRELAENGADEYLACKIWFGRKRKSTGWKPKKQEVSLKTMGLV